MKNGLVLSGGGSLGAYQVGVIKFLEEQKMIFDVVTGTSVGAINGALYVSGSSCKMEELWNMICENNIILENVNINETFFTEFTPKKIFDYISTFGTLNGADITKFKETCKEYLSPKKIKESSILLGLVCCTFPTLSEKRILVKDLDEKLVLPFIHASSACYPVFPIEKIESKRYVDGFYKNNFPIDYCLELGADKIIAVDMNMFNLTSKNDYLTELPNVMLIKPRINLGSFMDFRIDVVRKNIIRGYNDAMKAFSLLEGSIYSIEKNIKLNQIAEEFVLKMSKKEFFVSYYKKRNNENLKLNSYIDYLLYPIEILALAYEIDDSIIYSFEKLINIIDEKIKESVFDKKMSKLNKIHIEEKILFDLIKKL